MPRPEAAFPAHAGLCRSCQHARTMKSDRGSVFLQCQRSFHDSRFPKYPRLPVVQCDGYEPADAAEDEPPTSPAERKR